MSFRRAMMFGLSASSHLLNGLVGYWKLDGNSNDSTGRGHNGTDTSITYSAAKINNGAVYNGSTSIINVPHSVDFNFGSGSTEHSFSFAFWSYLSSTGTQFIICKRNGSSDDAWQIVLLSNKIGFYLFGTGGAATWIGREVTANPTQNVWEHYVVTYDGSKTTGGFIWYKNGSSTASTAVSNGTYVAANSTGTLQVAFGNALGLPLNGRHDEIGIWKDIILTSADASELYNGAAGKSYPF